VNPPGDELPAPEYLQDLLEKVGFSVQRFEKIPGRPNLLTHLPGQGQRAPLLFYGHTDVVGINGQEWAVPPFAGLIQDGVLYGRGALDMKAGVAMFVHGLLRAKAEGVRPSGEIRLLLVVDEESGGAADMVAQLLAILGQDVTIEVLASGPPTKPEVDYTLFDTLATILRELDPAGTPIPYLFNESPDGRLLEDHGLQNYGFLPVNLPPEIDLPSIIHGENERVPTAAIEFGAKALYELLKRY
jgi:acetylornithine deacetylase/succinyl-diaminopimelate desuccinylase-like protein